MHLQHSVSTLEFQEMKQHLGLELGSELAQKYVEELITASGGDIETCKKLFYSIGKKWGPLLQHWAEWLDSEKKHPPKLVMRDAKVLQHIDITKNWDAIWLNRKNMGIADELSQDLESEIDTQLLLQYIQQNRLDEPFSFIDSGCWGSIILKMYEVWQKLDVPFQVQPLFFFSHNPHIPGFINMALEKYNFASRYGEILNDSLEGCFLNSIKRPEGFSVDRGHVQPVLEHVHSTVIQKCSQAALLGVQEGALLKKTLQESIQTLINESDIAQKQGIFTGILGENSPTWSKGPAFLAAWPKTLTL